MLLSDKDIAELAVAKRLVEPFIPEYCEGATINLTLDNKIKRYISDKPIILGEAVHEDQYEVIDIKECDFYLQPNESVLVSTVEYFRVPDDLAAQFFERYSLKLLGLYISPASYLNPGYEGRMSFVAFNLSSQPIKLTHGFRFTQIGFFKLTNEAEKPYRKQDAKYMFTNDVSISKLHMDKDIQEFLTSKGLQNVSNDTSRELGDFLMSKINDAAKKIADELREKFGEPGE